jgi:phage host-nuclease inhibitor protein Gam
VKKLRVALLVLVGLVIYVIVTTLADFLTVALFHRASGPLSPIIGWGVVAVLWWLNRRELAVWVRAKHPARRE